MHSFLLSIEADVTDMDANGARIVVSNRISEQEVIPSSRNRETQLKSSCAPSENNIISSIVDSRQLPALSNTNTRLVLGNTYSDKGRGFPKPLNAEFSCNMDDLEIPWNDLVLKEKIGSGVLLVYSYAAISLLDMRLLI